MSIRVGVDGAPLSIRRTGVGRYLASLLAQSAQSSSIDFTVMLYYPQRSRLPELTDDLKIEGLRLYWPPFLMSRAVSAAARFGIGTPLRPIIGRQDVMVFTRYWHPHTLGVPSLTFVYDLVFDVMPSTVESDYLPRLTRAVRSAIKRSTLIAVISHAVETEIHDRYPATIGRTVVLTPGVSVLPTTSAEESDRVLRTFGLSRGYLLHVGTLEPRKNLVRLVQAVRSLPAGAMKGRQLVLVGARGWQDSELWEMIGRAGSRVRHIPFVGDAHLRVLYEGASVLVFPSMYEGFGLPILEAMTLGVPVACSDIPVHQEVARGAAVFFDPMDSDSIGDALTGILADDDRRKALGEAGLARSRAFDWKATAATFVETLGTLSEKCPP